MSNKQNDTIIDNLIDRAEELGIYELLIENPQGFRMTDPEEIESYLDYFEKLGNSDHFWKLGMLKAKVRADRLAKQIGVVDTCTEYGKVKPEENKKNSIIL